MITLNPNNPDEIKEAEERIRVMQNKQKALLVPFLDDNLAQWKDELSEKDQLELSHISKFILVFDESIKIAKKFERPDSIIEHNNRMIGLEHERIFNHDEVSAIKSKQGLFEKAATEFAKRYPKIKILMNFWLTDGFGFRPNQKSSLIEEIVNFVYEFETKMNPSYPSYIKDVFRMPHSEVFFVFNEGAYSPTEMPETSVFEAIKKKEVKIADYKANSEIETQWLLLVSGIGSDSFDLKSFSFKKDFESQFEHIYLLEDFDARVTIIK